MQVLQCSRLREKLVFVTSVSSVILMAYALVVVQWLLLYFYAISAPLLIGLRICLYMYASLLLLLFASDLEFCVDNSKFILAAYLVVWCILWSETDPISLLTLFSCSSWTILNVQWPDDIHCFIQLYILNIFKVWHKNFLQIIVVKYLKGNKAVVDSRLRPQSCWHKGC